MDRRNFLKASLVSAGALALGDIEGAAATTPSKVSTPAPGQKWTGWKKGHFQIHFIYTGIGEACFYIFPDGTTMLLDCGHHDALGRGKLAVPALPHAAKASGEWVARYVERVNPQGKDVDYMMLSHYHSDHSGSEGFYVAEELWEGKPYYISGFTQAAQTLNFTKAFDRCYPEMGDPLPIPDDMDTSTPALMRKFYRRMEKERGMVVEKFKVGAVDQVKMVHNASAYPKFSIRNICANGRIANPDGTIRDLYKDYIEREHPNYINENGMSLGMVVSYGPFRFFTAGDFSDSIPLADGTRIQIEDILGEVCGPADVAKVNHHGHHAMYPGLVKALKSQVYVSCVWDQLHNTPDSIERLDDRTGYSEDRVLYAGIYPFERRTEDDGKLWQRIVDPSCFEGSHIVLDVEPSGKKFSITTIAACDESMTVRTHREFKTMDKWELMKYIFVINGREDKVFRIKEDLMYQISDAGIQHIIYETQGVGDGIRYVRIYCDLHQDEEVLFIACGGSGTLNEVASGVVGFKKKSVGFLSYGQTNDFIKYFPDRDFTTLKNLLDGAPAKIDIIRANNWYSLNMINIGFDAYVSYEGNQLMDSGMGFKKAYALALLKGVLTKRRNKIQVTADGVQLNKRIMLLCSVANAHFCGGMFHMAPKASIDDGLIDVCLIKPCSLISFIFILKHFIKGDQFSSRFCQKRMAYCQARHLDIKSDNLLFISPDGEVCADIDFSIDILPGEINFVLPTL